MQPGPLPRHQFRLGDVKAAFVGPSLNLETGGWPMAGVVQAIDKNTTVFS